MKSQMLPPNIAKELSSISGILKIDLSALKKHTVFDLITAHIPISAQLSNSVVLRLQPVYFFVYFFIKAYVVVLI